MAKFVVFYNNELLKTYELDEPVVSIGRLPENTISIANMGVSRRHVKIEEDTDHSYVLSDLNSLNGTYVNGKRIKKVVLQSGDKISIGKYSILYEEGNGTTMEGGQQQGAEGTKKLAPKEYIGAAADMTYVHRTTEPHMRAVPEMKLSSNGQHYDGRTIEVPHEKESGGAVLIETNKHVVYKIDKQYMSMGSSEEDDIFISGFMVGEHQVSIEIKEDGIHINSTKIMGKMKVNGKPRRSHVLQHKDRIEVGSNTFRFMENG